MPSNWVVRVNRSQNHPRALSLTLLIFSDSGTRAVRGPSAGPKSVLPCFVTHSPLFPVRGVGWERRGKGTGLRGHQMGLPHSSCVTTEVVPDPLLFPYLWNWVRRVLTEEKDNAQRPLPLMTFLSLLCLSLAFFSPWKPTGSLLYLYSK